MIYYVFYVPNLDMPREPGERYLAMIPETDHLLHIYLMHYPCHKVVNLTEDGCVPVQ
jgi:hypothetical protein